MRIFRLRDYHPLGFCFPANFSIFVFFDFPTYVRPCPTTPIHATYFPSCDRPYVAYTGLGFSPFARRYFGNNYCSIFLWVLRCFTSPGSLSTTWSTQSSNCVSCLIRKSPDQRLLHTSPTLIAATLRPSSPLRAKASTIYSWVLLGTQKTITATYIIFVLPTQFALCRRTSDL